MCFNQDHAPDPFFYLKKEPEVFSRFFVLKWYGELLLSQFLVLGVALGALLLGLSHAHDVGDAVVDAGRAGNVQGRTLVCLGFLQSGNQLIGVGTQLYQIHWQYIFYTEFAVSLHYQMQMMSWICS